MDIKCCHRYLNCELLSAYERDGRYGGSFENRTRLFRESVAGAIDACGKDVIVTSRLNAYDGFPYPYGFGVATDGSLDFDPTEPIMLFKKLSRLGMEMINITGGMNKAKCYIACSKCTELMRAGSTRLSTWRVLLPACVRSLGNKRGKQRP